MELKIHQPQPQHRRDRYLIAVPVLGAGHGGASDLTGHVVEKTLVALIEYATDKSHCIDCVFACADAATHAHAQQIRHDRFRNCPGFKIPSIQF